MHVLGIDAGGTKTVCLLADRQGTILAEARAGGANLQVSGELEVEKVLHQVMTGVLDVHDAPPALICLGIAGVDREADAATIRSIMRRLGFKTPVVVVNDALIALTAGVGHAPGLVIVAGTGSIAYGRDAANRAARAGGWGYLLGDEGGGFWIGRAALAAVVREFDGRGPTTVLTPLVLAAMQARTPDDLVPEVYDPDVHRARIASIAAVVERAATEGDAVAAGILQHAGAELALAAASVVRRLELRDETFRTVLAGGIFRGLPSLARDVTHRLHETAPNSTAEPLTCEPAIGAVRLAIAAAEGTLRLPAYI